LGDILKIGLGLERLFFFLIMFFIVCHIMTCFWVISAQFKSETSDNVSWQDSYEYDNNGIYITSLYFIITTMTTVGYGDISGTNLLERIVSIFIMLIGVISFSFATGSLSSIM
jgi:protein-S-isoprenylcysteine O-methyltransferase Ste14